MKTNRAVVCSGVFVLFFLLAGNNSFSQLKAGFTSNVQSGCAPLIVTFQDQSTGTDANTQYTWNLGNGTISSNQNPITTYSDAGTYTVSLKIKNTSGQQDSISKTAYITVYSNPQAFFNASPTQGCFPLNVNFTNSSKPGSGTIAKYLWDFGDGILDSTANASHVYTSSGVFDITLKVTNSYGCYNALTKSNLIQINSGVNAKFSLSSLNVCKTPATAVFKDSSNGSGALTYQWDFGDGGKSTAPSPTYNYTAEGNYKVLLTVRSSSGCADTMSMPVVVHFPSSSFTHSAATCLNQAVQFTNTSVPAPISSKWYFGDGSVSTNLNPGKTYSTAGNYTVKLVNTFSSGCSDSVINTITIATAPTANFSADDSAKCIAPLTVNFSNQTTGAVSEFLWNFGDGSTSSSINPSHTYTQQGNFTVSLTATNSNGCQAVFQKYRYINIQPIKVTALKNLPDSGCVPVSVNPSVQLNEKTKIVKYMWDFGDGNTSTDSMPKHTYTKDGFFNVKVSVTNEDGCTASYTLANAVLAGHKPVADFTALEDSICASKDAVFTNTSTNGPITFLSWDSGPLLDSANGEHYYKKFVDTGTIKTKLVAFNYGCPDTVVKINVYVLPPIASIKLTMHCDNKQRVDFGDSSIADVTRLWDFGDNTSTTTKNPTHVYTTPGNYTIKLYTDNKSCHDTAAATINVINEAGKISVPGTIFCRGNNIATDVTGINLNNIKNTTWDFGDNNIVTVSNATKANHVYLVNGRFKIKATITDRNNCQYMYESDSITVYGPLANFTSSGTGACKDSSILFTDKSSSDGIHQITKWAWNFDDGADKIYNSPAAFLHQFADTGYYSVRLNVTDNYGCSDSLKRVNYVYISHPDAAFTVSDSVACPGKKISFLNASTGTGLNYTWNFGDGSKSNQQNPIYMYGKSGVYTSALTITDINGCKDSAASKPLQVSLPSAHFVMSDSFSTCPPLEVNFTNKSTNFTKVTWDFGDGSPSVIVSPTHVYNYPGTYPVKLIVNGYGSCADTASIQNIVIKGPTGKILYNPAPVCYPDTTHFSASASNVVIYTWDFSDGNANSTAQNKTSHVYAPGSYLPKLILQDASGCKVSIKGADTLKIFTVNANATVSANPACNLTPVQFADLSNSADIITHHYWYFGDDSTADQKTINHTYKTTGVYNAYLIAETKLGCRDTFNIPSGVKILPTPQLSIDGDSSVCSMALVNFTGNSVIKDSTIKWSWNFGNGKTASGQTVSTTYNTGNTYMIKLSGISSGGCADTATKNVVVHTSPNIKAPNDTSVCQNSSYQLTATGGQTYTWAGAGLSCTNCASPLITPNTASTYTVTGKSINGCISTDSVTINVITPDKITVSNADTLCVGETTKLSAQGAATYQWYPSTYLDNSNSAQPVFTASTDTLINYKVVGYTAKNCFADSGYVSVKTFPVPHMDISQNEITLNVGSSVQLNTHSSSDITSWRWQPPQGLSSSIVANPVASPIKTTTYSCIASNGGNCVARDAITIRVICGGTNVFIPNTFSPNNDGMNDVFYPRGTGLFNIKSFRIFNRWGQLVFERYNVAPNNPANGWDGSYNGKPLYPDVYVYIIEMVCENDVLIPFKGNVTLIK